MLTAADVEQKTFSTALRGYDLDEVDDFLDEVVATIRDLTEQLEAARDGIVAPIPAPAVESAPEPEPEPEPETVSEPEPEPEPEAKVTPAVDEGAIGRALIAAQTAADKLLEEAQSEATKIVDDAKGEAETWEAEKEAKRDAAEAEIARIAARVATVRAELNVLAGEVAEKLDDMDDVIAGKDATTETGGVVAEEDDGTEAVASLDVDEEAEFDDGDPTDDGDSPDHDEVAQADDDEGVKDAITDDLEQLDETSDDVELEEGAEDEASDEPDQASAADHLDELLNGVATDLQLGEDDDASEDSDPKDES